MKLYWFWSFNPQKVRLALTELDLRFELVTVDLFNREQRSPDFLAVNPFGKVPVLEDGDVVLSESNAILTYLAEREDRLWPRTPEGRAEAMRWLFFEARHLNQSIGRLWFDDFVAPQVGIPLSPERREMAQIDLEPALARLEDHLSGGTWILGREFSLVDCSFAAVLDALSLSDFGLDSCPAVCAYLERNRVRPSWQACQFRERVA